MCFGPKAPEGAEGRWIKTIPGRGWFVYFRIYGPEQPAFDGSWQLPDFQAMGWGLGIRPALVDTCTGGNDG